MRSGTDFTSVENHGKLHLFADHFFFVDILYVDIWELNITAILVDIQCSTDQQLNALIRNTHIFLLTGFQHVSTQKNKHWMPKFVLQGAALVVP